MNHEDHDDYPEAYRGGLPVEPVPSLGWCGRFVARAILIPLAVLVVVAFIFALSGCSQVSDSIDEFRETTELSVVGGWRDSTLWAGIRFGKVGRAREIEVIEGEKPFVAAPAK